MSDVSEVFANAIQGQPAPPELPTFIRKESAAEQVLAALPRRKPNMRLVDELSQLSWPSVPFAHQVIGLSELVEHPIWALAWDMGTGKTATVSYRLGYGMARGDFHGPVLICCPLSVVDVWREELRRHAGLDSVVCAGDAKQRKAALDALPLGGVLICNYETVRTEFDRLNALGFDAVIADEGHRIKNSAAQVNRLLRKVARKSRYRWLLTGTLCPNGPLDLFGTLLFLDPHIVGTTSKRVFEHRHAIYGKEVSPGIRVIVGYQNLPQLAQQVASVCSRVMKRDVCKSLPPKTYQTVPVKFSNKIRKLYKQLRDESVALLESRRGVGQLTLANVLSESLRLLQVCGGFVPDDDGVVHALEPNAKLELLADFIEDIPPQPIVIFAAFRVEVMAIAQKLGRERCSLYYGEMNHGQRQEELRDWRSGKTQYFIATSAAREGLTLTEASTLIYYSRTYDLLNWLQGQDRVYRIGQDMPVTIVSFVVEDTIDQKVGKALEAKTNIQEMMLSASVTDLL